VQLKPLEKSDLCFSAGANTNGSYGRNAVENGVVSAVLNEDSWQT